MLVSTTRFYNEMMEKKTERLILALVADLFFITRVQSVCDRLGYAVKFVETTAQVGGEGADFGQYVAESQPVLVIVDTSHRGVPWAEWLAALKAAPETAGIPVVCFGSHKDVETMKQAKQAGADAVLAKSRFTEAMPEIIEKYARKAE